MTAIPVTLPDRFAAIRQYTEALAAPLSGEDQTVQSMPDASPTKWHRGHTSWFFEHFFLARYAPGYGIFDDSYGYLFNSYYEAVGPRQPRPQRGLLTRPSADEVGQYRQHVDHEMADFLFCGAPVDLAPLVELGLQHEQQHQELLLSDVKHLLSTNPLRPAYLPPPADRSPTSPQSTWRSVDRQVAMMGHDGAGFAFDNETPSHETLVGHYEICDSLVTNEQWIAFIDDGGYQRPELWMSDGWGAVNQNGWQSPLYWTRGDDGTWSRFTLHGQVAICGTDPVCHVSWYEADAFARWADCRLPTESEWELAAPQPTPSEHPMLEPHNANDWYGQVWQWTASPYVAYPNFRPAAGAIGEYNGKFMVNQQVLRGSACITPPGHARRTYRNFYPPHARWAYAGLRLSR